MGGRTTPHELCWSSRYTAPDGEPPRAHCPSSTFQGSGVGLGSFGGVGRGMGEVGEGIKSATVMMSTE